MSFTFTDDKGVIMSGDKTQEFVDEKTIASLFGVSTRRIQQLKAEGVIVSEGRPARYDLLPTVKAYIGYLSDLAYNRRKKQSINELTEEKLTAEKDWKRHRADMAELELKELQGKMHRAEDVEEITTAHVMAVRGALLALPSKLAIDCASLTTAPEVAERIKTEIYSILTELSEFRYNADEYREKVQERQGWDEWYGDGNDGAGAGDDGE